MILQNCIGIEKISAPLLIEKNISLNILRLDQTDPLISGNKWFKLKYNLMEAKKHGFKTLLSFGGPFSNHIHALAAAGKKHHFNTIGIIRGEKHYPLNPTLSDASDYGMKLYFIDRKTYRNKHSKAVIHQLLSQIKVDNPFAEASAVEDIYLVPEGGTNDLAIKGAAEIVPLIPGECDYICVPCGTGGTIAGIISGVDLSQQHHAKVLGFPALKGAEFLEQTILSLLKHKKPLTQKDFPLNHPSWQLFYEINYDSQALSNLNLSTIIL